MRVLAIDTALEACSAAVLDTDSGIAASETLAMTRGHAEAVTQLIARVMSAAAIEFADLDRIAVTTGPGRRGGAGQRGPPDSVGPAGGGPPRGEANTPRKPLYRRPPAAQPQAAARLPRR